MSCLVAIPGKSAEEELDLGERKEGKLQLECNVLEKNHFFLEKSMEYCIQIIQNKKKL